MRRSIRVIKVGGSLFDWPQLAQGLGEWLTSQPSAANVLIAGGGRFVDLIRVTCQTHALGEESAHWLCIDAMSVTARALAALLPDAEFVANFRELQNRAAQATSSVIIFDPNEFLREVECHTGGCLLPRDWSATSDSIAARLAEILPADELVLLKSADPNTTDPRLLADLGYVDRHFPQFDRCHFRQQFVNLRAATTRAPAIASAAAC